MLLVNGQTLAAALTTSRALWQENLQDGMEEAGIEV